MHDSQMMEHEDPRDTVLKDLMDKMRALEGSKIHPKAVEVSVSAMKPEGMPEGMEMQHEAEDHAMDHSSMPMDGDKMGDKEDEDEMSPEDMQMLEHMFGDGH